MLRDEQLLPVQCRGRSRRWAATSSRTAGPLRTGLQHVAQERGTPIGPTDGRRLGSRWSRADSLLPRSDRDATQVRRRSARHRRSRVARYHQRRRDPEVPPAGEPGRVDELAAPVRQGDQRLLLHHAARRRSPTPPRGSTRTRTSIAIGFCRLPRTRRCRDTSFSSRSLAATPTSYGRSSRAARSRKAGRFTARRCSSSSGSTAKTSTRATIRRNGNACAARAPSSTRSSPAVNGREPQAVTYLRRGDRLRPRRGQGRRRRHRARPRRPRGPTPSGASSSSCSARLLREDGRQGIARGLPRPPDVLRLVRRSRSSRRNCSPT